MLKEHHLNENEKFAWLAPIPSVLIFGGTWSLLFHFIFDMATVGAILGVGHLLMFITGFSAIEIRMDIENLQSKVTHK